LSETPADRVSELERSTAMHFSQDWFSQHIPIWTRLLQPEQDSADTVKKQGGSTRDAKIVYAGPKFTFRR
jgi:hypothetical protein